MSDVVSVEARPGQQERRAPRDTKALNGDHHHVDLLVIGGGSGGFAAAIAATELGKRVGMVNAGPLGGTCTNRGCIPSKALIRAADRWFRAGRHPLAAVGTAQLDLDWTQVQAQKDRLIGDLRQGRYWDVLAAYPDITLVDGRASFQPDGSVRVGERSYLADRYLVATRARPRMVPLPGMDEAEPLTSTTLMELPKLPDSLLVLGGRAVSLELSQMMARLGVQVTILQRSSRLVPDHEPEIGRAIQQYLGEDGINVVTAARVERLSREGDTRVVHALVMGRLREYRADQVLLALGRQANTDGLGLDEVRVQLTADGAIRVNEFLQTSNPRIYAVGDVTTAPEYVYVAAAGGTLAAHNAFADDPTAFDLSVVPGVIFTDPQIATVGLTEAAAQAAGYQVKAATIPMDYVARAQVAHDLCGLIKLVADSATGRLLGAHVVTAEGGESIQTATLAVKFGLTIDDLVGTLFPYLTYTEGLRLTAVSFDKDLSMLSCCV
jgi:mercuric reductase